MTECDQGQRVNGFRQSKVLADRVDAFFLGVDTQPDGAQSECMGCKQDILGGSRAVLYPLFCFIA